MNIRNLATLTFAATIIGCGSTGCSKSKAADEKDNPFFTQWDTLSVFPPFEDIKVEHYKPAFEEGMKRQRQEIADIIRNNEAPSYENTIVPLEYSGKFLNRVAHVFFALNESMNTPEMQAAASEIMPMYSAFNDEVMMNDSLFQRINSLYDRRDSLNLSVAQKRALEEHYKISLSMEHCSIPSKRKNYQT